MKYFTPDLLARCNSTNDDTADAAQAEWYEVSRRYEAYLEAVRAILARFYRSVPFEDICMHDAMLRQFKLSEDGLHLFMLFELDAPSNQAVLLHYDLAQPPIGLEHEQFAAPEAPAVWLYDELELIERDGWLTFNQSILFSGGWELQLIFKNLKVEIGELGAEPRAKFVRRELGAPVQGLLQGRGGQGEVPSDQEAQEGPWQARWRARSR